MSVSAQRRKNAIFVPLGLIVKGCKYIQSPKGSSTCCLYEREDIKLVFYQNFFLVLRQIKRTTCSHKMDLIFKRDERRHLHLKSTRALSTQKNQALTSKNKSEPYCQEWHTKKSRNQKYQNQAHIDSSAGRESL